MRQLICNNQATHHIASKPNIPWKNQTQRMIVAMWEKRCS